MSEFTINWREADPLDVMTATTKYLGLMLVGASLGIRVIAQVSIALACPDYAVLPSPGCSAAVASANTWIILTLVAGMICLVAGVGVPWYLEGGQ